MAVTASDFIALTLGVLGPGAALLAWLSATKANKLQAHTAELAVDAEAYTRAKDIYMTALSTAQADLTETRNELSSVRSELATVRGELAAARMEIGQLRKQLRDARGDTSG